MSRGVLEVRGCLEIKNTKNYIQIILANKNVYENHNVALLFAGELTG